VQSCSRPNVFETKLAQGDRSVRTLEFLQSQTPDLDEADHAPQLTVESMRGLAPKQGVVCNNRRTPNSRLRLLKPVSGFLSSNSQFNDANNPKQFRSTNDQPSTVSRRPRIARITQINGIRKNVG
jgi:hypothetical protein